MTDKLSLNHSLAFSYFDDYFVCNFTKSLASVPNTLKNYHLFCRNLINLIFLEDSFFSGYNRIHNKILDRDWFSTRLFVIVIGPSGVQFVMVIGLSGVQFIMVIELSGVQFV